MLRKYTFFENALKKREEQRLFQQERCVSLEEPRVGIDFTSDDYLGLLSHSYVKKQTIKNVLKWGIGSTPSHMLSEQSTVRTSLEKRLATLTGREAALLFSSPMNAFHTLMTAIVRKDTLVFIDRFSHPFLSQSIKGKLLKYEHNDIKGLQALLEKNKEAPSKIILTESVFAFEGDLFHLRPLVELANEFDALLIVDETHAIGPCGKGGMGITAHRKGIDCAIGSFGKGFGSFLSCSHLIKDYLLNFSLNPSEALPPAMLGAIEGILDLLPDMEAERKKLKQKGIDLRATLQSLGFQTSLSSTHIIPLMLGTDEEVDRAVDFLASHQIFTTPLKPPQVPIGKARLRLVLSLAHTDEQIHKLITLLNK
ncbi:MAG: aminotransferase class I/II-fold pyridoxal phosphate-dependent enzyme [Simkaniaceae bacterium]|nr:aminotransferase class I/II-fold pyridoxal phosphate-dependent enzyme [Simkaniaceae bacterium]